MSSSTALTAVHLPYLRKTLDEWEAKQKAPSGFTTPLQNTGAPEAAADAPGKDVVVAFRTRPALDGELVRFAVPAHRFKADDKTKKEGGGAGKSRTPSPGDAGDLVVPEFCAGVSVTSAEPGVFVAHVPGMKWNGPQLTHKTFEADLAFGPEVDNEEVYQRMVVHNGILPIVLGGGVGCILAYGQTGSGKTYTMTGLEHRIARDLFAVATAEARRYLVAERGVSEAALGDDTSAADLYEISATFLELLGRSAADLVEPPSAFDAQGNAVRKEVPVREDKVGNVVPKLITTAVSSSAELEELITAALSHRRTSATARNATSSRSHALLTIRVKNKHIPYAEDGQLILVDLAGSERYDDSKMHDRQTMVQSQDNNKSLMNLKECVRNKAKMAADEGFVHIPWRMNKLTMLLKPIFDVESRQISKTLVIAHVSPHIQDSVHSVNTLGYAAPFKTAPPKPRGPAPYDAYDPRTWDTARTRAWLAEQCALCAVETKGDGAACPIDVGALCPAGMTARNFARLTTPDFVGRCLRCSGAALAPQGGWSPDELKALAATVIGRLFYLTLSSKTKKRNAVLASRRTLALDDAYGDEPIRLELAARADYWDFERSQGFPFTAEEVEMAKQHYGPAWDANLVAHNRRRWEQNQRDIQTGTGGVDQGVASAAETQMIEAMMYEWKQSTIRMEQQFAAAASSKAGSSAQ